MIYLSDTHSFIWVITSQRRRLGRAAERIFKRAERGLDEVRLSVVSLFEIGLLLERKRLSTPLGWSEWLALARGTPGLAIESLELEDIQNARDLVALVDPFDRLIAGTARRLEAPLLSADERIASSGLVEVVW